MISFWHRFWHQALADDDEWLLTATVTHRLLACSWTPNKHKTSPKCRQTSIVQKTQRGLPCKRAHSRGVRLWKTLAETLGVEMGRLCQQTHCFFTLNNAAWHTSWGKWKHRSISSKVSKVMFFTMTPKLAFYAANQWGETDLHVILIRAESRIWQGARCSDNVLVRSRKVCRWWPSRRKWEQ